MRKGFTLVELIVAMSVFLIAITIAVGAFVQSLKTQRTVNYLLSVNSNASLAIEQLAREIRTGHSFSLNNVTGGSCLGSQFDELEFTNSRSNKVFFRKEGKTMTRRECAGTDCSTTVFESLTASNVEVGRLCFTNTGNLVDDPWRVSLFLKIGPADPSLHEQFLNLETTVSARILPRDLP